MTNARRLHPVFADYDPFTDQRVDPDKIDNVYRYPTLPSCLHDAVARAKRLTGAMDLAALSALADQVDNWARNGSVYMVAKLEAAEQQGRDYVSSSTSDCLRAWLENDPKAPPFEEWPKLFGVLTLRLSGSIVEELWRDGEPFDTQSPPKGAEWPQPSKRHLEDAIEAIRSAGVGEGLRAALKEQQRRESNRRNARKSPRGKEEIKRRYLHWLATDPRVPGYRYQSHAIDDFLQDLRDNEPDLAAYISNRTPDTLRKHLKQHRSTLDRELLFA